MSFPASIVRAPSVAARAASIATPLTRAFGTSKFTTAQTSRAHATKRATVPRFSTAPQAQPEYRWTREVTFTSNTSAKAYPEHGPLPDQLEALLAKAASTKSGLLSENEVYDILEAVGLQSLNRYYHPIYRPTSEAKNGLQEGKRYVLKCMITDCIHKTDIGAITFNVTTENVEAKLEEFKAKFHDQPLEGFLLVEMLDFYKGGLAAGEYLLSSYEDVDFGPMLCFGIGGTGVEFSKDVMKPGQSHIFIPAKVDISKGTSFGDLLEELPAAKIVDGRVRGLKKSGDIEQIRSSLQGMQKLVNFYSKDNPKSPFVIEEIEINPAVAAEGKLYALDGVLRVRANPNYGKDPARVHTYDVEHSGKPVAQLAGLVRPKTAAVIGASSKNKTSPGFIILDKLQRTIPQDKLFAVHPREKEIHGTKAVKSLDEVVAELGGPVDLFVVGIPAASVGGVVEDVIRKNQAKCILTISGGFSETKEGVKLEKGIRAAIAEKDATGAPRPVISGPNTVGSYAEDGSDTIFTPVEKSSRRFEGENDCALIAQSGAFLITRLSDLGKRINPSLCFSVGNQMDMSATDCLEYILDHDPKSVIGMYMEGFQPGEALRLMALVTRARREGRAVIMYKSARSKAGKKAAAGHTASMAGDYDLFANLLTQAGAIVCQTSSDFEEIMACATIWGKDRLRYLQDRTNRPERVTVRAVSNAGFEAGAIADHIFIDSLGLGVTDQTPVGIPDWVDQDLSNLDELWKRFRMEGVVDIGAVLDVTPMLSSGGWCELMRYLAETPTADVGIFSIVPEVASIKTLGKDAYDEDGLLTGIQRVVKEFPDFPFVVSMESGEKYDDLVRVIEQECHIPCFRHADAASRTVARIIESFRAPLCK